MRGKERGHTHIRKPAGRQPHSSRAHDGTTHNQQVRMRILHPSTNLVHQRKDNQRSNGMGDESCDDEDQRCEDDEDAVETHAFDFFGDGACDGMQQTRRGDCFAEREAAGSEDDDGPEEIVEVFLGENARAEEGDHGDDGYNAHVAEDAFELMRHAPEDYGYDSDDADEVLYTGEFVLHRPCGDDGGAFSGLEGDEEEDPD